MEHLSQINLIGITTPPITVQQLISIHFNIEVPEADILRIKEDQYLEYIIKEHERMQHERASSEVGVYAFEV
jgi:hypothetical protein